MEIVAALSKADQAKLQQALEQLSSETTLPHSIEQILKNWELFTNRVEHGYRLSLTNYINSLDGRQFLERIETSLSEAGRKILQARHAALDQRFTTATTLAEQPLREDCDPTAWWYYRIPQLLFDELRDDLIAEGHFYLLQ